MSHPVYYYDIIKRPILSEKSHRYAEQNILSLMVGKLYTKVQIKKAVEALMGFKVQSVNTINVKPRAVRFRGNAGKVGGYKKAIVTIDKNVKINNDKLIV